MKEPKDWKKEANVLLRDPWGNWVASDVVEGVAQALESAYREGQREAYEDASGYCEATENNPSMNAPKHAFRSKSASLAGEENR